MTTIAAGVAPLLVFWVEQLLRRGEGGWSPSLVGLVATIAAVAVMSTMGYRGVLGTGRTLELKLRNQLDSAVHRLPEQFFRTRPSSDLAERAHGIHRLRDFPLALVESSTAMARLLACLVGIVVIAPGQWWAVIVLGVVAGGTPAAASPVLAEMEHRSRTLSGALSHVYLDTLAGLLPIRAHRAFAAVGYEHQALLSPWKRTVRNVQRAAAGAVLVTQLAGYGIALWLIQSQIAARRGLSDVLLIGFFSFLSVDSALSAVWGVRRIAPQWAVAKRLLALTAHALDDEAGPRGTAPVDLEMRDVTVAANGNALLSDVSLRIGAGEHLAVVGPSGSGKSTLMSVLLGWASLEAGEVLIDGRAIDSATAAALREDTAWVDTEATIWSGTVKDNVGDGAGFEDALREADFESVTARLGGTSGLVGESGRLLSGGEAQRLRLARALCRPNPRLVILDEAFRGLDAEQRARLLSASRRWWRDTTLVWVTHHVADTLDWDRVIVVEDGRIAEDGNPHDLMRSEGAYARLVRDSEQVSEQLRPGADWAVVEVADGTVGPVTGRGPIPWEKAEAGKQSAGSRLSDEAPPDGRARRRIVIGWIAVGIAAMAGGLWAFINGWVHLTQVASDNSGASAVPWWAWFLVTAGLTAISGWAIGRAGVEIGVGLRKGLLHGALRGDLEATRRAGAAEHLGRVMEADAFEQTLLGGSSGAVVGGAQLGAAFVAGLVVGLPAALWVCFVVWVILGAGLVIVVRHARSRWDNQRIVLTGHLTERFRGHRTEQVYGVPPSAGGRHLSKYQGDSTRLDSARSLLIGAVAPGWLAASTAVAIAIGTPSRALAAVGIAFLAWDGFNTSAAGADDLTSAMAAHRLFQPLLTLTNQAPEVSNSERPGAVSLHAASYTYPNATGPAIQNANLHIQSGDRLLLTGPSGGGKSTVATLLAGIRTPDSGVSIGSEHTIYVPQFGDNHAFQASFAYNVLFGVRWPPEDIDWAAFDSVIDRLGLAPVISRMPRHLAQPIGESGWQLSHGERTRVYLARALLRRPDVLILDETLAGLDPSTIIDVLELLRGQIPTLVVITHR
jgi:ABC-type multidrug transport system fused ATPase/permease subunit